MPEYSEADLSRRLRSGRWLEALLPWSLFLRIDAVYQDSGDHPGTFSPRERDGEVWSVVSVILRSGAVFFYEFRWCESEIKLDDISILLIWPTTVYFIYLDFTAHRVTARCMDTSRALLSAIAEFAAIVAECVPLVQVACGVDIRIQLHKVLPRRDRAFDRVLIHSGRALRQLRFGTVGVRGGRFRLIASAGAAVRFRGSAAILGRFSWSARRGLRCFRGSARRRPAGVFCLSV